MPSPCSHASLHTPAAREGRYGEAPDTAPQNPRTLGDRADAHGIKNQEVKPSRGLEAVTRGKRKNEETEWLAGFEFD